MRRAFSLPSLVTTSHPTRESSTDRILRTAFWQAAPVSTRAQSQCANDNAPGLFWELPLPR